MVGENIGRHLEGGVTMDANIEYITQIKKSDLRDIAAATNPQPGAGMSIERTSDGFRFSIDENQLKRMMWLFIRNGGGNAQTYADADAVSVHDLA